MHLDALRELGVPAVVYSRGDGGATLAARYGEAVTSAGSWDEFVRDADVIDVCTPTDTHFEVAKAAIEAGRAVVCEKPFTRDSASAEELAALADSQGIGIHPAHVVRYFPAYAELHDAVASGRLGRPVFARFTRAGHAPTWRAWFADEDRSGGIIFNQVIHDIDQARWTLGPVERVHARSASAAGADTACAMLALSHENGAISHVVGLWGPENTPFRTTYAVTGTEGSLTHDSAAASPLRMRGPQLAGEAEGISLCIGKLSPFAAELDDILRSIGDGVKSRTSVADAIDAVRIAEAALESARTGRAIAVRLPAAASGQRIS